MPYSFTVHGTYEREQPGASAIDEKIAHAKFVVAVSEFTRAQVLRFARGEDWPKVHVIRCGVAESFLARDATPLPEAARLLAVGRLDAVKGYPVLVQAASSLVKQGVLIEVTIVGDGPLRGALERQIRLTGTLASRMSQIVFPSSSENRTAPTPPIDDIRCSPIRFVSR